jgi:alkanesulfonate monooxygenase SsuD/methylene tetrahydromethanopterin reductase-like flavin-dependent oxidoreductase (luciferase family)
MTQPSNQATVRAFGLAASVPEPVIERAAEAALKTNYHSFWLNNPPQASPLPILGRVALRTPGLWLGVGVVPLSHLSPSEIVMQARQSRLPLDRFYLGIGSGILPGGIKEVAASVRAIKQSMDCFIVIAALGPRMCKLAGELGDGVLLNWLTPEYAVRSSKLVRDAAQNAGRPAPRIIAYVRAALGDGAFVRLREEAQRYESYPKYANHFARMGASALDASIAAQGKSDLQRALAAWDGVVDEIVIRGMTDHDTEDEVLQLVRAAAPSDGSTPAS